MPAISAARPGRASTAIAPDEGIGGGHTVSSPDFRAFALRQRRRAQLARQRRTGIPRGQAPRGENNGTDTEDMSDRLKAEREAAAARRNLLTQDAIERT